MDHRDGLPGRKSLRLRGYDYSAAGAYFITIVTDQRAHLFGQISDENMQPNELGEIVTSTWAGLESFFPHLQTGAFVLMPNHVHGIFVLTGGPAPDTGIPDGQGTKRGSIGAVVQNFKSISSRKINQRRKQPGALVWQRNYYDHIIRDREEWQRIQDYILLNPVRWQEDPENL